MNDARHNPRDAGSAAADIERREHFAAAFAAVAQPLFAWICLHVRAPLRARLDPEDVLQEVGLRAWRNYAEFDATRACFRAWTFGIARNVVREALKRLATSRAHTGPSAFATEHWAELPADTTTLTRRIAREDSVRALVALIEELPDDERRLVLYRGLEQRPHAEVAELVGTSEDSVAKRWQRLRERLGAHPLAREFLAA